MNVPPAKFFLLPVTQIAAIAGMVLGEGYTFVGIALLVVLALLFDLFEDTSDVDDLLDLGRSGKLVLYIIVALQAVLIVSALWAGTTAQTWWGVVGATLTLGQILAVGAVNVGHELAHCRSRLDVELGRAVVAPCLHTASTIDHVYRHHAKACTSDDPVTARRGETFFAFAHRSIVEQNRWTWQFERARCAHLGKPVWSMANRALRGHAFEALYLVLITSVFGLIGLLMTLAAAVIAVRAIESMFYMAHYGLVRVPGTPCENRHSWNSRRTISSGYMLNMTSHSHHHSSPSLPYWQLKVDDTMPILPLGPGILSLIAPIPPLWFAVMGPALDAWDRNFASDAERALVTATA